LRVAWRYCLLALYVLLGTLLADLLDIGRCMLQGELTVSPFVRIEPKPQGVLVNVTIEVQNPTVHLLELKVALKCLERQNQTSIYAPPLGGKVLGKVTLLIPYESIKEDTLPPVFITLLLKFDRLYIFRITGKFP